MLQKQCFDGGINSAPKWDTFKDSVLGILHILLYELYFSICCNSSVRESCSTLDSKLDIKLQLLFKCLVSVRPIFKEINTFICIKLIKSDIKDVYLSIFFIK